MERSYEQGADLELMAQAVESLSEAGSSERGRKRGVLGGAAGIRAGAGG